MFVLQGTFAACHPVRFIEGYLIVPEYKKNGPGKKQNFNINFKSCSAFLLWSLFLIQSKWILVISANG